MSYFMGFLRMLRVWYESMKNYFQLMRKTRAFLEITVMPLESRLALIEYVTTYFKEQLDNFSFPAQLQPALALAR